MHARVAAMVHALKFPRPFYCTALFITENILIPTPCFALYNLSNVKRTHYFHYLQYLFVLFVSESWVCCRVLGLFQTFHAHSTILNAHPTIFCFRVLGLFASFGFVCEFWVCFQHSTHTPRCSTSTLRFFVSVFWVCCRVLGLFRRFHAHTTMLNAHPTIFSSQNSEIKNRAVGVEYCGVCVECSKQTQNSTTNSRLWTNRANKYCK